MSKGQGTMTEYERKERDKLLDEFLADCWDAGTWVTAPMLADAVGVSVAAAFQLMRRVSHWSDTWHLSGKPLPGSTPGHGRQQWCIIPIEW